MQHTAGSLHITLTYFLVSYVSTDLTLDCGKDLLNPVLSDAQPDVNDKLRETMRIETSLQFRLASTFVSPN